MSMKKLLVSVAVAGIATIAFGEWTRTAGGTYDYNDAANWADGIVDGVFPSTLTLGGAQTITFSSNTVLTTGLTIAYKGNQPMTFVSDGTGAKTLTLGGPISLATANNGKAAHVTFGSATADDNLVIDLGGAEREFSSEASQDNPANIGWFNLYAELTNGAVKYSGKGTFKVYGANDYAGGTLLANSGYIYANANEAYGSGVITVDESSGPRLNADNVGGDGVVLKNDWNILGDFFFHGAKTKFEGKLTIPAPIKFWCESDNNLTIASPEFDDGEGNCAVANLHKWGSKNFRVDTPFAADVLTFNLFNGVWNQYGAITATNLVVNGDPTSTATEHLHLYVANDLSGDLTLGEGNVYVYLNHASALGGVTNVEISANGVLCCDKYKASGILSRIDAGSSGVLALGQNEKANFDMSRFAGLRIGANGGDRTVTGVVTPCSDGVYRLGGGGRSIILATEGALSGSGLLEVRGNNLVLTAVNPDFTGDVSVYSTLELKGDAGALPVSTIKAYGGTVYFNSNGKAEVKRAKTVHLYGGYLQVNGNNGNATGNTIDELIVDVRDPSLGTVGGVCHVNLNAGDKTTNLTVGKITRANHAIWRLGGTLDNNRLRVGGADGSNTVRFLVVDDAEIKAALVGGGGADGTPTVSIYPFALGNANTYYDTFLTYGPNGFRGLDYETEYVKEMPVGQVTQLNVRLETATTTTVDEDTTVNSLFLHGSDPSKTPTIVNGTGTIKVTSGAVDLGYHRNTNPNINCAIDFGDHVGVVNTSRGKASYWRGAIKGTKGMIYFQCADLATTDSQGTGLQMTEIPDGSTLTGDVVTHGYLTVNTPGVLPGGEGRPGNIYVYGYLNLKGTDNKGADPDYDGVFGTGVLYRNGETLTIGNNDAEGDFKGGSMNNTAIKKVGAARQRIGGQATHTGTTTVEEGVLQNDGAFPASAATVKTGATLAGSGAFEKLVTLEDGAKLEVGSVKTEDQVMDLNGGLTLKGDATLGLVVKDRETLGGVKLGGALTIPADKVVTVNVLADEGVSLRSGSYVVCEATAPLTLANFKRGTKCGRLSLSDDGTQLLMTASSGLMVIIK